MSACSSFWRVVIIHMQIPQAFLVGAPGGGELLLIGVVVLLMFGPKRLPEIARNIGKAMEYLRRTSQDFRDQVMRLDEEPPAPPSTTPSTSAQTTGQADLPVEGSDSSSMPEDPYHLSEEQGSVDINDQGGNLLAPMEQENETKTESTSAGSTEGGRGTELPVDTSSDKLAG